MKIKTLMLCLSFSFSQFTFAKNHPLKFCYEDQDSYPWVLKDGSGLNITLLKILAKKLNTEVTLSPVPWKRCLEGLKNGKIFDGAFAASYKVDRLEFGRYPTLDEKADGKPNENKRLHINEYSLYVLKEDNSIKWDGKQITGVQIIGSLPGYSINDFLIKLKLRVDDGTRLPSGVFEKLVGKRFAAVAMQDYRGDYILQSRGELNAKIKKISPPLEKKAYYLMLSKDLVNNEKDYAKLIWDKVEEIRNSKEYKTIFDEFLKSKN